MNQDHADKVIAGIEEWWQERRFAFAMDTETHNREAAQIEELKDKIRAMVVTPRAPRGKNQVR